MEYSPAQLASGFVVIDRHSLSYANMRYADLRGALLYGADLRCAGLYGADMRDALLRGANMRYADLRYADLRGAGLYGADMHGADFTGARLNWQSRHLIAEILRQAAGYDRDKRMVAGLVLVSAGWCWDELVERTPLDLREWALRTLAAYVQPGDHAPEYVTQYIG